MQFIDLKAQYKSIEEKIDNRIKSVLNHGKYIMGPEVGELETSPTIDVSQKTGLGLRRLSNPSSTLRARRKNSILDMRDTGRLDTIQEARDE